MEKRINSNYSGTPDWTNRNNMDAEESKRFGGQINANHKLGNNEGAQDEALSEFLHSKLPRKHVSEKLIVSIREKIKAYHL